MHRSLKRRIVDRTLVGAVTQQSVPRSRLLPLGDIGAIASALVAIAALAFGYLQYKETLRLQQQAVLLQERSTEADRSAKAVELFEKYLGLAYRTSEQLATKETPAARANRHNRALLILNAIHSVTRGDDDWAQIVSSSLSHHEWLAEERGILCLSLTRDFRALLEERIPGKEPMICRDMSYSGD